MHQVRADAWDGVEIRRAVSRLVRGHWPLLLGLVAAGLLSGLGLHVRDHPRYSASARVALDVADPQGSAGSQVVSDTARAIVTSRSHVAGALAAVPAQRDPAAVAERDVTAQQMGASGIVQVVVTDEDPGVAAALANALAADLVETRRQLDSSRPALVIDPAARPDRPTPSRWPLDAALGAILGLLAGIVVVGVLETLRPAAAGADAGLERRSERSA
jgi:uncharacterized protein involved in exopolysaccharide biosynthesis